MKLTFDAAKRNGKLRLTFAATKGMENLAAFSVREEKRTAAAAAEERDE